MALGGKSSRVNREQQEKKNNDKRNVPVLVTTYFVLLLFIVMFVYLIRFVVVDADTTIANSYNKRQSIYAEKVIKGQIISSDGEVLAETLVDDDGNETRYYPYKNVFAHVIGYDSNGQSGLEMMSTYYLLTSNQNIITQTVNALSDEKSQGNNVITTISYNLQTVAYNAMGDNDGAVVVMEPDTGKILVMLSKPDYDPNNISELIAESQDDNDSSYLLNRATQGLYPPGSTFKVLTALEYIRENPDTYESYSYECESEDIFAGVSIHCYNSKAHGFVDLKDSLAYSCNTSFANIGMTLDLDELNQLCEDFLYNSELPYDGVYKQSQFDLDGSSESSEIPQTVIGQGNTLITPLHNAMIMATIANGGVMMQPYLIDRIENCDGALVKKFGSSSCGRIIDATEAATMIELLTGVTEYGTAADKFAGATYTVAGKTGTAEYNSDGDSHSWFVGFSNVDNPDIVVCVIIENASSTGSSASAVARKIFDAYYLEN